MAKRVLVVDDYAPTVDLVRDALEIAGFSVLSAENGAECLLAVGAEHPDLVILDVAMPVMDGLKTLRVLRENPDTRHLPVILLTGRSEWPHVVDGWREGASLYLTKPVKVQAVVASARWLLGMLQPQGSLTADERGAGPQHSPLRNSTVIVDS